VSLRINTNVMALNAQHRLTETSDRYGKALERLSSGLRINRAADDAAGLAVSEKLRTQVRGMQQAARNAQDGISMIQTAEGALVAVHDMLQRMRELSVQAANDTLSMNDRAQVNAEVQQLRSEVNAIAGRTKFNGQSLLSGSLVTQLDATSELKPGSMLGTSGQAVPVTVDISAARPGTTYQFSGAGASLTLTRTSDGAAQTLALTDIPANGTRTIDFSALGIKITLQASQFGKLATGIVTDLSSAAWDTIVTAAGAGSANLQIGPNSSDMVSVSFGQLDISPTGLTALDTALTNFNTTQTATNAQALITALDAAIDTVSTRRSGLGAMQNRLEYAIQSLKVGVENLSASESRIRDADVAEETTKMVAAQILTQAGTSVLAQANQAPQGALALLRGN
jgi:flagellin